MKITIQSNADFTPKGKRTFRVVRVGTSPFAGRYAVAKGVQVIRWYVSGKIYNQLPATQENLNLSTEWRDNTQNLLPQPWKEAA